MVFLRRSVCRQRAWEQFLHRGVGMPKWIRQNEFPPMSLWAERYACVGLHSRRSDDEFITSDRESDVVKQLNSYVEISTSIFIKTQSISNIKLIEQEFETHGLYR